jgi:hypothetical protein
MFLILCCFWFERNPNVYHREFLMTITGGRAEKDHPIWKKSSRSAQNGHCVEVAQLSASSIGVRDSKDNTPDRPVLIFGREEWESFLCGVNAGKFDLA